ncbi:MAG TPA: class I SAM-dependent methyltransferase [Candidatus Eisenbacteria bacterium]
MKATGRPSEYDAVRAASYWSGPRHDGGDELAAVLSLGEPVHVNAAYDAWETGLLLDALAERGAALRGASAIDVGAGVGRVSLRVAPRVARLVCGDLAPGMLHRLGRNAKRARVAGTLPVRLRSDRLPLRDRSVSLVLCLGLLEHLPLETRRASLREAARVLRSGGLLALVLNNAESRFLRDPEDNPLRTGRQRENGYYCAVVGDREVLAETAEDFDAVLLGSNLLYSLHRHAARLLDEADRGSARLAPFFERAAAWDRSIRPVGPLARAAADHHLYLLTRR